MVLIAQTPNCSLTLKPLIFANAQDRIDTYRTVASNAYFVPSAVKSFCSALAPTES